MKFVQRLVKFSEAKGVIEAQAAQVKDGSKEMTSPLKKNLDAVEMYKEVSENGVIHDDTMVMIEVEEPAAPTDPQDAIMSELAGIKKSIDGMAKAGPEETTWMLERVVRRLRERMSMAEVALDSIAFAQASEAAAQNGQAMEDSGMSKEDFKKLLNFDSIIGEVGQEAADVVKKMLKGDGAEGEGDPAPEGDPEPEGAPASDGDPASEGDPAPESDPAPEGDQAPEGDSPEPTEKDGEEDADDDDGMDPSIDLSPPLPAPGEEDTGGGDVDIEV